MPDNGVRAGAEVDAPSGPPHGAVCIASGEEIQRVYRRLADEIGNRLADRQPLLIAVLEGGRLPTREISRRLSVPHDVDALRVGRYGRSASGGRLRWHAMPDSPLRGRAVVVVDDILDEGVTLAAVVEHCRSVGAGDVLTCVLAEKAIERPQGALVPDFLGLRVPDCYVVGCGMDYRGRWRDLPALYALEGDPA